MVNSVQWVCLVTLTFFTFVQNSSQSPVKKLTRENQTPAEDRDFFEIVEFFDHLKSKVLPPKGAPHWGPFGWKGASKLCPFIIGPYPGIEGRACYGPYPFPPNPNGHPPGQPPPPPPPPPTTTTPPPPPPPPPTPAYVVHELYGDEEEEEEYEYVYKPRKRKRCRCQNCKCRKCRYHDK